jgi:hypothetical protein
MEIVPTNHRFPIPVVLAVCPYCGAEIEAYYESWVEEDDGTWKGEDVQFDSACEPHFELPEWDDWFEGHKEMPYVYVLPVCQKIEKWINMNYRFQSD